MKGKTILYIGKATSLKDRVQSYYRRDLELRRGPLVTKMIKECDRVRVIKTRSVLEALLLETALIKKHQPLYNKREKDDKSYLWVTITKEPYPKVILTRGNGDYGPFAYAKSIRAALRIIRRIFPYRDTCQPVNGRPCFYHEIGLCPGVCVNAITEKEYRRRIANIRLLFQGKSESIVKALRKEMAEWIQDEEFEKALATKKALDGMRHINDTALLTSREFGDNKIPCSKESSFRIEGYDVAHLGGAHTVGSMAVVINGLEMRNEYRKFKIRTQAKGDDLMALREILKRRLSHPEWQLPNLVVIDGGMNQLGVARKSFYNYPGIPIVGVQKDSLHRPRTVIGDKQIADTHKASILLANGEAHRFALAYHRKIR